MEEQVMETKKQRPTFLTVLCILTFIICSYWILSVLIKIIDVFKQMTSFENYTDKDVQRLATTTFFAILMGQFTSLAFAALSLWGVIKMWNLKKSGFWLYVIPNSFIVLILLIMSEWLIAFLYLIFIILYALNLKHMS